MRHVSPRAQSQSGDHVRAAVIPANILAEPHFGLLDGAIVFLFALCAGGLIYWILG